MSGPASRSLFVSSTAWSLIVLGVLSLLLALLTASVIAIGPVYGAGFASGERTPPSVLACWRWRAGWAGCWSVSMVLIYGVFCLNWMGAPWK